MIAIVELIFKVLGFILPRKKQLPKAVSNNPKKADAPKKVKRVKKKKVRAPKAVTPKTKASDKIIPNWRLDFYKGWVKDRVIDYIYPRKASIYYPTRINFPEYQFKKVNIKTEIRHKNEYLVVEPELTGLPDNKISILHFEGFYVIQVESDGKTLVHQSGLYINFKKLYKHLGDFDGKRVEITVVPRFYRIYKGGQIGNPLNGKHFYKTVFKFPKTLS